MKRQSLFIKACLGALFGIFSTGANATLFTGASGNLAASVDFSISGNTLTVVLTNTASADVLVPIDVLTAVFFDISGNPTLTSVSALLTSGSSVFYDPQGQPAGGNVGGEWEYAVGVSGPSGAGSQGISSSGLGGAFGQPNFNGPNLQNPVALNGLQYGILSAGDNTATGNGGISGSGGLIKNSVTFTLTGIAPDAIFSNVYFQYGTDLTEPGYSGNCVSGNCVPPTTGDSVPEPEAPWLLALSLLGFYGYKRKLAVSRF
ncbi:MAG: hypothetical protein CTY24_06290 [Methylobacter sp.]|nr:MAG: hypothetical protein CTY24_06290 [Methylobacter sp.]